MLCQWKAAGGADVLCGCPGPLTSFPSGGSCSGHLGAKVPYLYLVPGT
jgi:hypothetical protein